MISRGTVLEIYGNPQDLTVNIGLISGTYCIAISRGPMHRYKPLVSQISGHPVREDAVCFVESVLCAVVDTAQLSVHLSSNAIPSVETVFLNKEIIAQIVSELATKDCVETCAFFEQKK